MTNSTVLTPPSLSWPFLERDAKNRVRIAGTRIRLSLLVEARQANGWSAEELHLQYPVLSLAQVYSALSYYYSHQQEIQQEIEKGEQETEKIKQELIAMGAFQRGEELKARLLARANQV